MDEDQIMGNLFRQAEQYIKQIQTDDVFVEIGSARGAQGSTHHFAQLAHSHGTVLHSVDIDDRSHIFQYIPEGVIGHQAPGSEWSKYTFPTLNKKIALLYLDNYDYNYWVGDNCQMIQDQLIEYQTKYNITLNNTDCTVEHLKQMINLLPYMSSDSVVICDDTFLYNDCWIGKCGPAVVYLLACGWEVAHLTLDCGVILTRKKK